MTQPAPQTNNKWKGSDLKRMIELKAKGHTQKEIAQMYGVNDQAIHKAINRAKRLFNY